MDVRCLFRSIGPRTLIRARDLPVGASKRITSSNRRPSTLNSLYRSPSSSPEILITRFFRSGLFSILCNTVLRALLIAHPPRLMEHGTRMSQELERTIPAKAAKAKPEDETAGELGATPAGRHRRWNSRAMQKACPGAWFPCFRGTRCVARLSGE